MEPITVAIPVGPEDHHRQYLGLCMESVRHQLRDGDEVLFIDDMGDLSQFVFVSPAVGVTNSIYRAPWRLGVAHAFNFGVALARNRFVLMLGADDELAPNCLDRVREAIAADRDPESAYFYLPLRYMDTGEVQTVPCNAAVVSRKLWERTGGFQPESAVGACDAAFISTLMVHRDAGRLVQVGTEPLYYYRRHPLTDTATRSPGWQGPIIAVRNLLTEEWKPTKWGRYQ